jgi:hypothetical protein
MDVCFKSPLLFFEAALGVPVYGYPLHCDSRSGCSVCSALNKAMPLLSIKSFYKPCARRHTNSVLFHMTYLFRRFG